MRNPKTSEIFIVRYAHLPTRMQRDNFIAAVDPHDGDMPIDYYVWAIASECLDPRFEICREEVVIQQDAV